MERQPWNPSLLIEAVSGHRNSPLVVSKGCLASWDISDDILDAFDGIKTTCRFAPIHATDMVVFEGDCIYLDLNITDIIKWSKGEPISLETSNERILASLAKDKW